MNLTLSIGPLVSLIAGILILFVNIVGGLFIGILQHNLPLAQAANNYVLLSIGDGLVAQVPALIISTAAGLIVSRVDVWPFM